MGIYLKYINEYIYEMSISNIYMNEKDTSLTIG